MRKGLVALAALVAAAPAWAGPPYGTDDPVPTDPGRAETYLFVEGDWRDGRFGGEVEAELNYGAAPDLQLSLALPVSLVVGEHGGFEAGNVEAGVKWRFHHDAASGVSLAVFPSIDVPTVRDAPGVTMLLPVWGQWERGGWTLFGGGGRAFRTGAGQRDGWEAGVALTREVAPGASLGVEVAAASRDADDGHGEKGVALGGTLALGGPFALIGRAGPVVEDDSHAVFARAFLGLQGIF